MAVLEWILFRQNICRAEYFAEYSTKTDVEKLEGRRHEVISEYSGFGQILCNLDKYSVFRWMFGQDFQIIS